MTAALKGRRNSDKARSRRELLLAYHSGAFSGAAFNGQLKPFQHYAREIDAARSGKMADALHFFRSSQVKGLPISIERVARD